MRTALITGVAGLTLAPREAAFLKEARPAGLILFARNLESHAQIRALIDAVCEAVGSHELLVLIDQEGGRVQRLRPPLGRKLPPAAAFGRDFKRDPGGAAAAAFAVARLLADDLKALGINTNCAPVVDLPVPGSHEIIGDRAYGSDPAQVIALAKAVAEGFMAGGVVPVIKHIPGHGRATADSHLALPVVTESRAELSATDFAPFKALSRYAGRDDGARGISLNRPRGAGEHVRDRHARDHPRRDRLRWPPDERRPVDEGAGGRHARPRTARHRCGLGS